jgi:hypothetical protein
VIRTSKEVQNRKDIYIVVEHFGGGPAFDVRFAFDPPLVNHDWHEFHEDPPFSTGIAFVPPRSSLSIRFDDFNHYQDDAGGTRIVVRDMGVPGRILPLTFRTTVTLRDPLAEDKEYVTSYDLDLQHLMDYTMEQPVVSESV